MTSIDYDNLRGEADDRLLAGLAHISVFFLSIILPLIIFLLQRSSGRPYVVYQSLQALVWQLAAFVVSILLVCCMFVGYIGFVPALLVDSPGSSSLAAGSSIIGIAVIVIAIGAITVFSLAYSIIAIVGAVKGFQGEPFTYPFVGKWARRFMPAEGA